MNSGYALISDAIHLTVSRSDLLIHSSIAAVGVVLLLSIVTRNWRMPKI